MRKIIIIVSAALLLAASCGTNNKQTTTTSMNPAEYCSPNPEGMQKVCDFVKGCGVFFIATEEGDQPRVRPFGVFEVYEGKVYIQTGHVKNVAKQLEANPKIGICAFNGKEWIRIAASAVEDPRVETKAALLDMNPNLKSMYSADDPNTAVYYLTSATATINSFSAPQEVIEF